MTVSFDRIADARQKLAEFKKAARELNESWEALSELEEDIVGLHDRFPFERCFNELTDDIQDWGKSHPVTPYEEAVIFLEANHPDISFAHMFSCGGVSHFTKVKMLVKHLTLFQVESKDPYIKKEIDRLIERL